LMFTLRRDRPAILLLLLLLKGTNSVEVCKYRAAVGGVYDNETFPKHVILDFPSTASCAVRTLVIASLSFKYTPSAVVNTSVSVFVDGSSPTSLMTRVHPPQINSI